MCWTQLCVVLLGGGGGSVWADIARVFLVVDIFVACCCVMYGIAKYNTDF